MRILMIVFVLAFFAEALLIGRAAALPILFGHSMDGSNPGSHSDRRSTHVDTGAKLPLWAHSSC